MTIRWSLHRANVVRAATRLVPMKINGCIPRTVRPDHGVGRKCSKLALLRNNPLPPAISWNSRTVHTVNKPLLTKQTLSFSTTTSPNDMVNLERGDYYYKMAMDTIQKMEEQEREKDETMAAEQYEAMQTAFQKQEKGASSSPTKNASRKNTKAATAVIRTIRKQARADLVKHVTGSAAVTLSKWTSDDDVVGANWQEEVRSWIHQAAFEHGHGKALVRLGNEALKTAADSNSKPDIDLMTHPISHDLSQLNPVERAAKLYEMAGANGQAEGWYNLGHILWTGYPESEEGNSHECPILLKPDQNAALDAFERAIQLGDPDAMFFVGVHLLDTPHAKERGFHLINQAATSGHGVALHYLALLHLNGNEDLNISSCTNDDFVQKLNLAANAGHADSLSLRAQCFYFGEHGYDKDPSQALQGYIDAAEKGNPDAAVSAGAMLHKGGSGVREDKQRSFEFYQKAAEMGSIDGWRNVVACYALGEGVPRCERTAEYISKTMLKKEDNR